MDTSVLVDQAKALTRVLDATPVRPRAVLWVRSEDTDSWRLWIVPSPGVTDMLDFYRRVAVAITNNREKMAGLDIGSVELVGADHPAMVGMAAAMHAPGIGSTMYSGNRFDGYYLPESIVIRMDLQAHAA